MSTTGTNTNCATNEPTCLCGIEVTITPRVGDVEITFGGGHLIDGELVFTDNQSVIWTDELGEGYVLNFNYNDVLLRWELSYGNNIVIGVFYSESQCPLSNCDWDLECIGIEFKALGTTRGYYSWGGEYFNGKRAYYFSSDWDGVSTIDYQIVWDLIPPSAGAPSGTYAWIFSDATEEPATFIGFLLTDGCPYGSYVSDWEGTSTRFQIADPGVSDYTLTTKAIECGCCDTNLLLEIGVEGLGIVTADGNVEYDAYGNILGINGHPYYVFDVVSPAGSCDCISVTYKLIGEDAVTVEVGYNAISANYTFTVNGFNCIIVYDELESYWTFYYNSSYEARLFESTPCPFGVFTIDSHIFELFEVSECEPEITTYYLFFLDGEWVVKTSLESGPILELPRAVLPSNSECPFGFYSANINFYSFWVRGAECFDCCDYYTPRFSNFIKKKKYELVGDISAIRNKEIFGMKCGPEWSDLFKNHLILDVLHCLPYGVLCEEEEQCLIKNVNENCNC